MAHVRIRRALQGISDGDECATHWLLCARMDRAAAAIFRAGSAGLLPLQTRTSSETAPAFTISVLVSMLLVAMLCSAVQTCAALTFTRPAQTRSAKHHAQVYICLISLSARSESFAV
eukprot:scaffold340458_cov49-Prasinocladus_malaysianus.AAC.1